MLKLKISKNPYNILNPEDRWKPRLLDNRSTSISLPPLVEKIREEVKIWRNNNYNGITKTSKALLEWWFSGNYIANDDNKEKNSQFYYFSQREAMESIIYLYEFKNARSKTDLLLYDKLNILKESLFEENWLRFVIKMATGSGKTKVMSLVIAWSYFHKLYEKDSTLSRNFLILAPNIIVLDRLKKDFNGLYVFNFDPVIPVDGYEERNWKIDFKLDIHLQSDAKINKNHGNLFLTNVQRIYPQKDKEPTPNDEDKRDFFLGTKANLSLEENKIHLNQIINKLDELLIINDEAHHIHDPKYVWFQSIARINRELLQKNSNLCLQIDTTATPKDIKGNIFPQTICDYPLVEAIYQNIVKKPHRPKKLQSKEIREETDIDYAKRFRKFIHLGYEDWKRKYNIYKKINKKAIFFIMTDKTKHCEEVAEYLRNTYPEFKGKNKVLVIHTNNHGEFIESKSLKNQKELAKLRKLASTIDDDETKNPYIATISVMMLKEGWDVKNVTTIVGLRAYASKILPEQTLGRGLRRMNPDIDNEPLGVIGTENFMKFVEQLTDEGVIIEEISDDDITKTNPLVIEIDKENEAKNLTQLDIKIPILTRKYDRDFSQLEKLNINDMPNLKFKIKELKKSKKEKIDFIDTIENKYGYSVNYDSNYTPVSQGVIKYFTQIILKHKFVKLSGCFDILYPKVKDFITTKLFEKKVNIEDINILKNLNRIDIHEKLVNTFIDIINKIIIQKKVDITLKENISVCNCKPFFLRPAKYIIASKCPFNFIAPEEKLNNYELEFAAFLDRCDDIISFTKNYKNIGFTIDYVNEYNHISQYQPDFLVKMNEKDTFIIETKGRVDEAAILKKKRLEKWCIEVNKIQKQKNFQSLYIKQDKWNTLKNKIVIFEDLILRFKED